MVSTLGDAKEKADLLVIPRSTRGVRDYRMMIGILSSFPHEQGSVSEVKGFCTVITPHEAAIQQEVKWKVGSRVRSAKRSVCDDRYGGRGGVNAVACKQM